MFINHNVHCFFGDWWSVALRTEETVLLYRATISGEKRWRVKVLACKLHKCLTQRSAICLFEYQQLSAFLSQQIVGLHLKSQAESGRFLVRLVIYSAQSHRWIIWAFRKQSVTFIMPETLFNEHTKKHFSWDRHPNRHHHHRFAPWNHSTDNGTLDVYTRRCLCTINYINLSGLIWKLNRSSDRTAKEFFGGDNTRLAFICEFSRYSRIVDGPQTDNSFGLQ